MALPRQPTPEPPNYSKKYLSVVAALSMYVCMYGRTPRLVALITICILRRRRVRADSRRLRLRRVSGRRPAAAREGVREVPGRCRQSCQKRLIRARSVELKAQF